jgi:hypothetical protein
MLIWLNGMRGVVAYKFREDHDMTSSHTSAVVDPIHNTSIPRALNLSFIVF